MSAQDKFRYYISQVDKEVGINAQRQSSPSHLLTLFGRALRISTCKSQLNKYPTLVRAEQQTGVPKAYGVIALAGLFSTFIFFNLFAGFLTTLLGWGLPAYFSLKALETPSHGDDTQWLTYWVVFGGFQIVEYFSDFLLYW